MPKKARKRGGKSRKRLITDLYLFKPIRPDTVKEIIEDIIEIRKKSKKIITLYISSPGGYVHDGLGLISVMEKNQIIRCVSLGCVASMAVPIFLMGKRGERYIAENSFIMLHPIATDNGGDYISFVKSRLKNTERLEEIYDKIILGRSKIPKKVYERAKNSELWLDSKECLKYGLADKLYKGGLK